MTTIVQIVHMDETGDSLYRMRWPARDLASQRPEWRIISLQANAQERFAYAQEADLLVLFQSSDLDLLPILQARKAAGKKTLVEYNDNFYDSPPWGPVAKEWSSPLLWGTYERFMLESDGVLVTGSGLKDLFSSIVAADKIHILDNHLPSSFAPCPKPEHFTFGWAGSLGHIADLIAIRQPVIRTLQAIPTAHLHLMGNESIPAVIRVPHKRLSFTCWGTMEQYFSFWKPIKVGIVPMLDTPYNHCRSDVKALEISALGAVPLLPDALPYRDFLRATGLRPYRSVGEIEERLIEYAYNPDLLAREAEVAYTYVHTERCGVGRRERAALYAHFIDPLRANPYFNSIPAGSHEIQGTPSISSTAAELLTQAQTLVNENQADAALQILLAGVKASPYRNDLAFAAARLLIKLQNPQTEGLLTEWCTLFPRDLRFVLLSLSLRNRESDWNELLARLTRCPQAGRRAFLAEIERVYNQCAPNLPLEYGDRLLAIFPHSAVVRLAMAEGEIQRGDDRKAAEHYRWLAEHLPLISENRESSKSIDLGYVQAWSEGLHPIRK